MPDDRRFMPRIRMPRLTAPGRASRAASETTTANPQSAATNTAAGSTGAAEAGSGTEPATKETQPATVTPGGTKPDPAEPAEGAKAPEPNLQERIEGLQGWMAEIERKQARLTYFGGFALLLALGAAGAALYFGLTAHSDSATKNDLDALTNRVNSLQGAVTKNSKDTQNALNASIAQLQQSLSSLQKKQAQAATNISTLQGQVAAGALNKKATPGATPSAPGATTTTTTPNNAKKP
jgi:uncharacterized protein HemX